MSDVQIVTRYITKNPYFSDGRWISGSDFWGFILHDVACCQDDPLVFIRGWDSPDHTSAGINGFIGDKAVYITAPSLETKGRVKRMPHACSPANNHYIGFETCNPKTLHFNANHTKFTVDAKDLPAARAYVAACYGNAVALFARLCKFHSKDPLADGVILSHKEAGARGIASQHGDIEGLWNGLGMGYTMNGFRADVARKMKEEIDMTKDELMALIESKTNPLQEELAAAKKELAKAKEDLAAANAEQAGIKEALAAVLSQNQETKTQIFNHLAENNEHVANLGVMVSQVPAQITDAIDKALGPEIAHLEDAPKWLRKDLAELLEYGVIDGGTPADVDPTDVHKRRAILEAVLMAKRCIERYAASLLLPQQDETGEAAPAETPITIGIDLAAPEEPEAGKPVESAAMFSAEPAATEDPTHPADAPSN